MADSKVAGKAKRSSAYAQKLKDPRWQRKRLEIMQRDDYACQLCGDTEETLHVHHKRYVWGNDPWDYPADMLVTLCVTCHESVSSRQKQATEKLVSAIAKHVVDPDELVCLAESLDELFDRHGSEQVSGLLDVIKCDPALSLVLCFATWQTLNNAIPAIIELEAARAVRVFLQQDGYEDGAMSREEINAIAVRISEQTENMMEVATLARRAMAAAMEARKDIN